ncbi:hypothetical protein ACFFUT_12710 [Pseudohalocynthiibacter aestuariivivens]|uniref:Uncharacterized protein n=1 Tax=Pseudohalocynthiibacter aestuariivivens TaxID=1591409 RepID=A0ABV5JGQ9_9RHOB|nr:MULTISPECIES: hypothetical protein [Pseudohalocynthiibacter]MBS9718130.1 hypothetical protein [Pseudohalocynthiibacter aestuariivivens]MCK0103780.1 hypothetical protein [Pseudohalocynthiibacter sp. F2068]
MNDINRLKSKLEKLGAEEFGAKSDGHVFKVSNLDEVMTVMLREIDETLLGRELEFRNDRGDMIGLEVSGRRLLCVSKVLPERLATSFKSLLKVATFDAHGPEIDDMARLLDAFSEEATKLKVTSHGLSRAMGSSEVGCSPDSLAQAWSLDAVETTEENEESAVASFLASCRDIASAWIQLKEGSVTRKSGDEALIERLVSLASDGFSIPDIGLKQGGNSAEAKRCIVLRSPSLEQHSVLFAENENRAALVLFPAENLSQVISKWHSAVA